MHYTEAARDEIEMLQRIAEGPTERSRHCVRLLDSFDHSGPNGLHVCMVFEVLSTLPCATRPAVVGDSHSPVFAKTNCKVTLEPGLLRHTWLARVPLPSIPRKSCSRRDKRNASPVWPAEGGLDLRLGCNRRKDADSNAKPTKVIFGRAGVGRQPAGPDQGDGLSRHPYPRR